MMSWAVTDSVGTQLWIDRTCRVNLNYSGRDKVASECLPQTKSSRERFSPKNMRHQYKFNLSLCSFTEFQMINVIVTHRSSYLFGIQ